MLLIYLILIPKAYSQGWVISQIDSYVSTIYNSCQNYQLWDKQSIIVCFGGQVANEAVDTLMTLNLTKFTYIELQIERPSPRYGHESISYQIKDENDSIHNYFLIHGGQVNESYFNEIWIYEVAQYYSINPSSNFTKLNISNSPTLSFHAVDVDPNTNIMYIFGGQTSDSQYSRKLYKYNCSSQTIEEVKYNAYQNLTQTITLWDNTQTNKSYSSSEEIQTYLSNYVFSKRLKNQFSKFIIDFDPDDCDSDIKNVVPCLSHHRMLYNSECDCLFVFGGRKKNLEFNQDVWVYDFNQSIWFIYQTNLQLAPRIDFDIQITDIFMDSYMLFGGKNQNQSVYNDYWYFNYKIRQWNQIQNDSMDQTNWPDGLYGFSMQLIDNAIYFVGGEKNYLLYTNNKPGPNGIYNYGVQFCNQGWKGVKCDTQACPGICFNLIADKSFCIECSENGDCVDGACKCDDGYTGTDCSELSQCVNNCSQSGSNLVGECNQFYPFPQCKCDMDNKRGGDDCSVIFCLNDCSSNGDCVQGSCNCQTGYVGSDCSIFGVIFLENFARILALSYIFVNFL